MGVVQKLDYLNATKAQIKAAIEQKGVTVGSATFRQYAQKVSAIPLYNDTLDWYGIEWDYNNPNPAITRIGNLGMHASLPIQNKMKGCLLADNGTVNYYLKPDNWSLQADGSTPSVLDGSNGQVMIEMPAHYVLFEESSFFKRVKFSEVAHDGWLYQPKSYISAYEASLDRDTLMLSSVMNGSTKYRGGNNTSAWDGTYRSLLGMPATNISLTNFRVYARNRGEKWTQQADHLYASYFWLNKVEYANRNSQDAVNNNLTAEGYKQGGLGTGITTTDSTTWNTYNGSNPFSPCGHSNSLGNFSGEVTLTPTNYPGGISFKCNRYRGIENPFGHIWKWLDGIVINSTSTETQVYATRTPGYFSDDINNKTLIGLSPRANNYYGDILFGATGSIQPKLNAVVGSALTYWCDYYYQSTAVGVRAVCVGGTADYGSSAGFGCSHAHDAASGAAANIGARLCYIP